MPIVYANIPQSIYCSRLTYLPSCLGFFHTLIQTTVVSSRTIFDFCSSVYKCVDGKSCETVPLIPQLGGVAAVWSPV